MIYCEVIGVDQDGQTVRKGNDYVFTVYVQNSFWENLYRITFEPLVAMFRSMDLSDPFVLLVSWVLAPVILSRYADNFNWLFAF